MDISKGLCDGGHKFLFERREGRKDMCLVLLADLLGSQYLLETLQTSLTFKNSENMEKNDCFNKNLRWRPFHFFFEIKEGYKVSCAKLLMFWYIIRRSVFL